MLEKLFWFGGRMGRLAYFGWSFAAVAVSVAVLLLLVLLAAPVAMNSAAMLANPRHVGAVAGIGTAVIFIWMSLALQTKRLRDMGCDPFVWIVGVWTVTFLDQFVLSSYVAARYPSYVFGTSTLLGGLVSVGYWLILLFTPSADGYAENNSSMRDGISPASRLKFH